MDPYVVVRLDGIEMRSEPVHKSSSPTFRFSAQMTYALSELAGLADKSVQIEVRDGNDMLGMCSLDLLSLTTGPSVMQNISLLDVRLAAYFPPPPPCVCFVFCCQVLLQMLESCFGMDG